MDRLLFLFVVILPFMLLSCKEDQSYDYENYTIPIPDQHLLVNPEYRSGGLIIYDNPEFEDAKIMGLPVGFDAKIGYVNFIINDINYSNDLIYGITITGTNNNIFHFICRQCDYKELDSYFEKYRTQEALDKLKNSKTANQLIEEHKKGYNPNNY